MHNHKQHSTLFVVLSVGVLLFSCLAYYLFVTEPWASKDATKLGDDAQVKVSDKRSVPDVESHSKARGQQKVASSPKTPSPVPPPASFISALKNRVLNEFVPINNGTLTISTVDAFNNLHLAPRLQSITDMDYFRFVKLNLKNKCTLWPDNTKCALRFVVLLPGVQLTFSDFTEIVAYNFAKKRTFQSPFVILNQMCQVETSVVRRELGTHPVFRIV